VIWLGTRTQPDDASTSSDYEFNVFARNLAAGHGHLNDQGQPSSCRAPGFSFFLAVLYALAGTNYALAFVALCVLGAASCILAYLLAREFMPENWARVVTTRSLLRP
jgi:hypothetical protein